MATILVNNVEHERASGCETWGELLNSLDRDLAATGKIVTAARFDGVDEPTFRDPSVTARQLAALQIVEIDAGSHLDLVARTLDQAIEAIGMLSSAAEDVSTAFRGYDIAAANRDLAPLAGGIGQLVAILRAVGLALRVDLDAASSDGQPVPEMVSELLGFIESLIEAQRSADWLTVADIVEYDIGPALGRWRNLFLSLRNAEEMPMKGDAA